ncbi:MAG: YgcG family protein, partial [Sulfuricella sp.]|nr:YgcG family protein [Sulfuricella sp.]
ASLMVALGAGLFVLVITLVGRHGGGGGWSSGGGGWSGGSSGGFSGGGGDFGGGGASGDW